MPRRGTHWNCPAWADADDEPRPQIRVIYIRIGQRWVKVGDLCLRCHEVWPLRGVATAEEAAAAA